MKSKLSASTASLTFIKGLQNPIVTEIKELTKKYILKIKSLKKLTGWLQMIFLSTNKRTDIICFKSCGICKTTFNRQDTSIY